MGLFVRFSRLFSVRNWDVLSLFALVPGVLLIDQAKRHGPLELLWYGYLWLLCGSVYLFLRCVIDLALVRRNSVILIFLSEDKRVKDSDKKNKDPEAQLIAQCIAAFDHNNQRRQEDLYAPPLDVMEFPGMVLKGTRMWLYLVRVTRALSEAVANGEYPAATTVVRKCEPKGYKAPLGMWCRDYRQNAVRCLLAFQKFVGEAWEKFTFENGPPPGMTMTTMGMAAARPENRRN